MTAGKDFRDAYRRALADQHKAARNRCGRRARGLERADLGRLGLRIPPPRDTGTEEEDADGQA
jgi:hypothetical protein